MGSGYCFNNLISLKRSKRKLKNKHSSQKGSNLGNSSWKKTGKFRQLTEDVAATQIQSAFRAYKARKALRGLKGVDRFRGVIEEGQYSVKNQGMSALNHIHFWSRIQTEIKARWLGMVVESRARQKKLENQFKLDSKLHELEVEWSGGPETMEEILNRIQHRETAAAKRERTMAYAFSHQASSTPFFFSSILLTKVFSLSRVGLFLQWRANSNHYFGQSYYDLSKESWGWSWKERWVAVRPWEKRYQTSPTPIKKVEAKQKKTKVTNPATTKPTIKPAVSRKTSPVSQEGIA